MKGKPFSWQWGSLAWHKNAILYLFKLTEVLISFNRKAFSRLSQPIVKSRLLKRMLNHNTERFMSNDLFRLYKCPSRKKGKTAWEYIAQSWVKEKQKFWSLTDWIDENFSSQAICLSLKPKAFAARSWHIPSHIPFNNSRTESFLTTMLEWTNQYNKSRLWKGCLHCLFLRYIELLTFWFIQRQALSYKVYIYNV